MSLGKLFAIIFGVIFLLMSLALIVGGGMIVAANRVLTDDQGYYTSSYYTVTASDEAVAVVIDDIDIEIDCDDCPKFNPGDLVKIKIDIENNDGTYFVGVAKSDAIDTYLANQPYAEITDFSFDRGFSSAAKNIGSNLNLTSNPPNANNIWVEESTKNTLFWEPDFGNYAIVFMKTDGSSDINMKVSIGAKIPVLDAIGAIMLILGIILLIVSIILFYLAARSPKRPVTSQQIRVYTNRPVIQEETGGLVCSNCGSLLESDAKFCAECGEKVVMGVTTPIPTTEVGIPAPKAMKTVVEEPSQISGENVYQVAEFGTRFWAWLIDMLIVNFFVEMIRWPFIFLTGSWDWIGFPFGGFLWWGWSLNGAAIFIYWIATEYYWNGQSIGKNALNLMVIRDDGSEPEIVDIIVSAFGKAFLLPIDFLIGALTNESRAESSGSAPLNQRLFQQISKTVVVTTSPTNQSSQVIFRK
ncbi:MAG: RDD family protein [Candidatus Hodarchaeales archaeon]|jgi:uncharacterized RDD family membrane protein YckC